MSVHKQKVTSCCCFFLQNTAECFEFIRFFLWEYFDEGNDFYVTKTIRFSQGLSRTRGSAVFLFNGVETVINYALMLFFLPHRASR